MSITKKTNGHKNGVTQTLSDVSIQSMMDEKPAKEVVRVEPVEAPPDFRYETTRVAFEGHKRSVGLLAEIHRKLDPVFSSLVQHHPEALLQISEVAEGWRQKVRDQYEAGKKEERRRHGGR